MRSMGKEIHNKAFELTKTTAFVQLNLVVMTKRNHK
jgi:hypothetical protein